MTLFWKQSSPSHRPRLLGGAAICTLIAVSLAATTAVADPLNGITLPTGVKALPKCPPYAAQTDTMQDNSFGALSEPTCIVMIDGDLSEPLARELRAALEAPGWSHGFGGAHGMVMQREGADGCFESLLVGVFTESGPTTESQTIGPDNRVMMVFASGEPICETAP